jgi:hypothetical protein
MEKWASELRNPASIYTAILVPVQQGRGGLKERKCFTGSAFGRRMASGGCMRSAYRGKIYTCAFLITSTMNEADIAARKEAVKGQFSYHSMLYQITI